MTPELMNLLQSHWEPVPIHCYWFDSTACRLSLGHQIQVHMENRHLRLRHRNPVGWLDVAPRRAR